MGESVKTEERNKGIIMAENSKGGGRVEQTVCVGGGGSALSHSRNGYVFHRHN